MRRFFVTLMTALLSKKLTLAQLQRKLTVPHSGRFVSAINAARFALSTGRLRAFESAVGFWPRVGEPRWGCDRALLCQKSCHTGIDLDHSKTHQALSYPAIAFNRRVKPRLSQTSRARSRPALLQQPRNRICIARKFTPSRPGTRPLFRRWAATRPST